MTEHVHEWYLDSEMVHTDDGPPQPRRQIFIECLRCPTIFRGDEIVKVFDLAFKMTPFREWLEPAE